MNVVILAAGQGKRMRSALPKVLHPIAGEPMLVHVIGTARELHPTGKICIVYGHGGEQVPAILTSPDLAWARQEPQLGTGHAVLQALPMLDPAVPALVLYGDVPLIRAETLQQLLLAAGNASLGLLTVDLPDPSGYGRIVRERGRVRRIVEEKDASGAERSIREVNTGILVAPTHALLRWLPALGNRNAQGEYYLTDIVAMAVDEGLTVETVQPSAVWEVQGVNSKSQLAALERIHQENIAQALMEEGVALADPARIDVRGQLICGTDVSIDVNAVFEGIVELADGVRIGPHCVLRNCRIGPNARIEAFTHIEDAQVGAESIIGPYARLRPGARLGREVHIGNFVEIKNSTVADQSKANHLAYVGDATVGCRVNIGAGTIVANFDGANKHRTIIEDDAHTGSNSVLVAPITVGRGATIGAGSTVSKDVPPEKLTVARTRAITIGGWKRPVKHKRD
ncbi:MAG: bifunctional UDP-N-acetylglucosamine diphosphorylase/glucosamine-1-phosphate N-acetyltransferase GlmU [Proteobacteria bacterium]|nr:bifunctional UDP-N-acetylglucosamine diphosphorylase/glucosamine-1-phosphate N-acetyltransferase GlmU [Pseudomonadota bacterium]HQR05060.1 bifunctional UDP-N-acetylglucosamine diphosphorylase/glucosamine-1-phosphate N-acetyltransferase GlmU [Rhodocyclaceae bacterium]